ncbi:LysR family transcriptional regulator [Paraferrimonas sedimenticola]|uniref:LysR family transcriptional regulator n=1 Tax=Paraferrimonas sedimenticola TaxID=375674 RepID=A0AA37S037_9GAMM|nr:LysR family transcriptional regulator [Paraferrimonas sedimenticola]GLP97802.1 LysR family transcriptional regulator [Paraferrimonas sedimenticola]
MNFSLAQLQAFVMAAQTGTFQAAAIKLNKRAQAVSKLVASMEDSCAVVLFERKARHLEITAEGRKLLNGAQRILKDADNLSAILTGFDEGVPNNLSVAIDNFLICPEVTNCLKDIMAEYPTMDLDVLSGTTSQVAAWVLEGKADIGLRAAPLVLDESLTVQKAFAFNLVEIAPPNLFRAGEVVDEGALYPLTQIVSPFIYELNLDEMHVVSDKVITSNNLAQSIELVKAGLGWTVAPYLAVRDSLESREVVEVATLGANRHTWMSECIYLDENRLSVAADLLVQKLSQIEARD